MVHRFFEALSTQPFVLLFLVVAAGYALGRLKIRGIGLGATASTLIIGLALSVIAARAGVSFGVSELVGTVFFNLFMFSIGMKVGPQFLVGIRRDAKLFIAIGIFIPVVALGLTFVMREVFSLSPGLMPGIFAGANTATPGLGAAHAAFASKGAGPEVGANMSTAFAFAYCISVVLFTLVAKLPDLLGKRTTAQAAKELEAELAGPGGEPLPGAPDEFHGDDLPVAVRTYAVEESNAVGHRIGEIRRAYPELSIERVLRAGNILQPTDELVIQLHDTLALHGRIPSLVALGPRLGPEIYDEQAGSIEAQTVDVIVHDRDVVGRTIGELAHGVGHGLYLNAMFRAGEEVPHGRDTVVHKGDVLRITGSTWRIEALAKKYGNVVRSSLSTDIATLAFAVALGALVGWITIPIGSVKIQVGAAVGLLIVGMVISILRTRNPSFGGPYPEPARQLIEDLGLNIFVAVLGLNAGLGVLSAIGEGAVVPIVIGTLIIGFIPPTLAWLLARKLFKMNESLLLGAVAGGRCNSPGLRVAIEESKSSVPAISYPATFAISNILFTIFTYVLALLG